MQQHHRHNPDGVRPAKQAGGADGNPLRRRPAHWRAGRWRHLVSLQATPPRCRLLQGEGSAHQDADTVSQEPV